MPRQIFPGVIAHLNRIVEPLPTPTGPLPQRRWAAMGSDGTMTDSDDEQQ